MVYLVGFPYLSELLCSFRVTVVCVRMVLLCQLDGRGAEERGGERGKKGAGERDKHKKCSTLRCVMTLREKHTV